MLDLRGKAELRAVTLRKEFHGEEDVKAVTLSLRFQGVPLDVAERGFVGQLSFAYQGDDVRLSDVKPLEVSRHISNVEATLVGMRLSHMVVKSARVALLPKRLVNVDLRLNGRLDSGADALHDALMDTVEVSLVEREFVAGEASEGEAEERAAA